MDKSKRVKNEKEFDNWEDLPEGGRKYHFEVLGKMGGFASYIKITDADEKTISFVQEIYDSEGKISSIHEKYPIDKGHQKI
jgi:hypothetical protein